MQSCWRSPNATACSGEPADGSGTSKEEKELDEHENQLADEVLELEEVERALSKLQLDKAI
eukprot:COSAG04_NODE_6931_length_1226_cov_1.370009_1_plen_60_part_10